MAIRVRIAIFCSLIFAAPALPEGYQKVGERRIFNGETILEYRLTNGLGVLLVPRHQAPLVSYQVWLKVGSIHEKLDPALGKTGLAHLFEHMMFRGTMTRPDGEFDRLTIEMGAQGQNATTSYYRTNYFQSIPSRHLEKLIELEADRVSNLKLTEEILEKEKGAVVGELRRLMDSPGRAAQEELFSLMFTQSPFRFNVIGTEQEIRGFTVPEAQHFYKTFYAPNNATVIVVGDTEESQLLPWLVKYYGGMPRQQLPAANVPSDPLLKKEVRKSFSHPQATSELLMVGYPGPEINSPEAVVASIVSSHLSTGMESVLRKKLVDSGIAVSVSAAPYGQPALFQLSVQLAEGKASEAGLKIIEQELNHLKNSPVSKESLERAINQDRLSLYSDISNDASLAQWMGEYFALCGNYMRGFEIIDAFKKVSAKDVQIFSKKYFQNSNRAVVMVRANGQTAPVETVAPKEKPSPQSSPPAKKSKRGRKG